MSKDAICYAPPLYNILSDAIQYYDYETPAVCSPIYEVFYTDEAKLLPRFLYIWLKRKDFKRYAAYYALGVRQTFDFLLMQEVQIPLPPIDVQQSIIDLYKCLEEAKKIAAEAREKMRTLCPALIQKAANA
jgi:type I restriction enzyme S subunit